MKIIVLFICAVTYSIHVFASAVGFPIATEWVYLWLKKQKHTPLSSRCT